MTDYILNNNHTFSYRPKLNIITIGDTNFDLFTDNEVTEYTSDALTHEYIHKVLFEMFDMIVCSLFDGIEYLFRNNELHERHLVGSKRRTYQSLIKEYGYKIFLDYYQLDKFDVIEANILCNKRKEV